MKMKSSAISITVSEVPLSSKFLHEHFGFEEKFNADGFAYLHHPDAGMDIVFLRLGMEVLPQSMHDKTVEGLIVAFVVEDIEAEEKRLKSESVAITLSLQEDPWGERLFQVEDPNGVTYQVVQWVEASDQQYANNPGNQKW
ncbi:MAG TPA: VOC family protein [Anaerolineales bacterium]|nr:VOC family protein [Anaerolineales bacterium]